MRLRRNKLDFIRILLLKRSIAILALTETWLDETWNDVKLTVPGYNLFSKDRKSNIELESKRLQLKTFGTFNGKFGFTLDD